MYNIFVDTVVDQYNIFGLNDEQLHAIVEAYLHGDSTYTISGTRRSLKGVRVFKVFTHDLSKLDPEQFKAWSFAKKNTTRTKFGTFLSAKNLKLAGSDITESVIGNNEYGCKKIAEPQIDSEVFVDESRIKELKALEPLEFDLSRLIKMLEELNNNYQHQNYLSVGMIGRTVLNHVPPIFELETFNQVASNYGAKSFKKSAELLNNSLRTIADSYLHQVIRKKEALPNRTQVDFRPSLDVVLEEVVRILREKK